MSQKPAPTLSPAHRIAGMAGNVMEWYDFAVFGYLVAVIGPLFFPQADAVAQTISTFGVFAVGFLVRPLGAVVFGHLGDTLGRKKALMFSIVMMALPTFLLGCLPTYAMVGIWAPVLLTIIRLIQGLSVGGEFTGSITYLTEAAHPKRRGLAGSWSACGAMGGFLLGSIIATIITHLIPEPELSSWGWRIPFWLGAGIGILGLWVRNDLPESESFETMQEKEEVEGLPLKTAFVQQWRPMLLVALFVWSSAVACYLVFLYLPTYLHNREGMELSTALLLNTIALAGVVVLIPAFGHWSDKLGRRPTVMATLVAAIVLAYPAFRLFDAGVMIPVLLGQAIFALIVAAQQGLTAAFMAEQFDEPSSRFTAFSVSFNISYAIFGGTTPVFCAWLIDATGDVHAAAYYLMAASAISLGAVFAMRDMTGKRLV